MNFEVNGIPYLLTFDSGQAQWFLLTTSRTGIESVDIYHDGELLTGPAKPEQSSAGATCVN